MPIFKRENNRREKFCQLMADGSITATEAYIAAGYKEKGAKANSSRLIAYDTVKERIAEIKSEIAVQLGITREIQHKKLEEIRAQCKIERDWSNALGCVKEENKLYGLIVDKTEDIKSEEQQRLDGIRAAEARRIAAIALKEKIHQPVGALDRWSNGKNSDISSESEESGSLSGQ
jgi:phage terminase small subunit